MRWIKENAAGLVVFIAMALFMLYGLQSAAQSSQEEGLRITEDALRRAVVSCYALEGRYPPDVAYLQKQYGLQVNEDKYIVHYEIFAENIMPEITVLER